MREGCVSRLLCVHHSPGEHTRVVTTPWEAPIVVSVHFVFDATYYMRTAAIVFIMN